MTNPKLIEMVTIIDKSGSMGPFRNDSIGSFNTFLEEQRSLVTDIDASFTLIQFNDKYEVVYDGVPIKDVPELTTSSYRCEGCTALYDAVGRAIDTVGNRLSITPEENRPSKVIVMVLTDGQENASKEYTGSQIKDKIKTQESQYQWEFRYLSADPNAFTDAGNIGISAHNTMNVNLSSTKGIRNTYSEMSRSFAAYRS